MTYIEQKIFNYVKEIMVEISFDRLQETNISVDKQFKDYAFDYIQVIDIIIELERKLGVTFSNFSGADVLFLNQTIYDFIKILNKEYTEILYENS